MRPLGTIDRDIFQSQLDGIAEEMSKALSRSAYSPIIWDVYDYSCAVFTPQGEMLAQAETIPAQLGTMSTAFKGVTAAIPLAEWKPGDVFLCNDPYRGCTHTLDLTMFSPVFHEGVLVAITSTIAHHIDVGGARPGTTALDATEIFMEGLIIPPCRLIDGGKPVDLVFEFIRSNFRYPNPSLGDLRAQIAGCRIAERRLAELAQRHGAERFTQLATACLDYGELYARGIIAAIPDGTYEAETLIEDGISSPEHISLKVRLAVADSRVLVDFAGSSPQRRCGLNCPWSSTISMTRYAVRCVVAPETSQNGGLDRCVLVVAPQGNVLNPMSPAAVSSRHYTQQAVADVVLKALARAAPERAAACSQISVPIFGAEGIDDRPARPGRRRGRYITFDIMGGGMGGSPRSDGLNAVDTHGGNCALISAEVMETASPVRVLRTALVPGSGGVGEYRGGLALERDYEFLARETWASAKLQQASPETAPGGAGGGAPGATGFVMLNPGTERQEIIAPRGQRRLFHRGEVIRLRGAGGGGYGDPARRMPELRTRDEADGLAGPTG